MFRMTNRIGDDSPSPSWSGSAWTVLVMTSLSLNSDESFVSPLPQIGDGLTLNSAERDAPHQIALQYGNGDEYRERAENRHGGDFRPEGRLRSEVLADLDRKGEHFGPRQHQSEEKLVPGKDESENGGSDEAVACHRHCHLPQNVQMRMPVEQCRLIKLERYLLYVTTHHPHCVGERECSVKKD